MSYAPHLKARNLGSQCAARGDRSPASGGPRWRKKACIWRIRLGPWVVSEGELTRIAITAIARPRGYVQIFRQAA
jgi:hypothetical protein